MDLNNTRHYVRDISPLTYLWVGGVFVYQCFVNYYLYSILRVVHIHSDICLNSIAKLLAVTCCVSAPSYFILSGSVFVAYSYFDHKRVIMRNKAGVCIYCAYHLIASFCPECGCGHSPSNSRDSRARTFYACVLMYILSLMPSVILAESIAISSDRQVVRNAGVYFASYGPSVPYRVRRTAFNRATTIVVFPDGIIQIID